MQLIKNLKNYLNVCTMLIIHYENTFRVYHYLIAYKNKNSLMIVPCVSHFTNLGNLGSKKNLIVQGHLSPFWARCILQGFANTLGNKCKNPKMHHIVNMM